ncbi:hypothetical protein ACKWTF_010455 [Chironomus riparius]
MEILRKLSLVIFVAFLFFFKSVLCSCKIEVKNLVTKGAVEPLFLSKSLNPEKYYFNIPRNGFITVENGEDLYSFCRQTKGKPPVLTRSNCINDKFDPPINTVCPQDQAPIAKFYNSRSCGQNLEGRIFEIGYELIAPDKDNNKIVHFMPLTTVCHNKYLESTFYSQHVLYKGNMGKSMKTFGTEYWDSSGYDENTADNVKKYYNDTNEKAFFKKINLNTDDRLSKGHLNPNGDQPFQSWKKATYFYLNQVPQWQVFNQNPWENIEFNVKKQSDKADLIVFTGGHGQFKIGARDVFMSNITGPDDTVLRIQVPKLIWKLFFNVETRHCLAFVIMNYNFGSDAFEKRDPEMCSDRDDECKNLDDKRLKNNINNVNAGFLSCCSYKELIKMIKYELNHEGAPLKCLTSDEIHKSENDILAAPFSVGFSAFTYSFSKTKGKNKLIYQKFLLNLRVQQ